VSRKPNASAPSILIISALDIWSMGRIAGAQTLYRTLCAYADSGFLVCFLTSARRRPGRIHPRVETIHIPLPDVLRLGKVKKLGFLARSLWWILFQVLAFFAGLSVALRRSIQYFYGYEIYGVPAAWCLGRLLRRPVISRFQGTILAPQLGRRFWRLRFWPHIVALKAPVDLVVMGNDGTQGDRVLDALGVPGSRVRFWLNGVDPPGVVDEGRVDGLRRELGLSANNRVLLTVSRLVRWKRVDRSIEAMPKLVQEDERIRLVVVGDGDERANLEQLAKNLGVEDAVVFAGAVAHDEIPVFMRLSDVFVSLYELSNVGNPLLEAMMLGCCIITLNNGSTGQFVIDGETGVLLEEDELDEFVERVLVLLRDDALRLRLGEGARRLARERFWGWEERLAAEIEAVRSLGR